MCGVCQRNWAMEIFMLGLIWDTVEDKVIITLHIHGLFLGVRKL